MITMIVVKYNQLMFESLWTVMRGIYSSLKQVPSLDIILVPLWKQDIHFSLYLIMKSRYEGVK